MNEPPQAIPAEPTKARELLGACIASGAYGQIQGHISYIYKIYEYVALR